MLLLFYFNTRPCPKQHSLFALGGVSHRNAAVVGHPHQLVPTGRERDTVHPASTVLMVQKYFSKRHLGPPGSGSRFVLNVLNVGREYPKNTLS